MFQRACAIALSGLALLFAGSALAQCVNPSPPQLTFLSSNAATVEWSSFGNQASNAYDVFLQFDSNPPNGVWLMDSQLRLPAGAPLVASFTGLLAGSDYRAVVYEYCTDFEGAAVSASTDFTTLGAGTATGCLAPGAPSVDELTANSATVSWTSPNEDAGHRFRVVVQTDAQPGNGLWVGYQALDIGPGASPSANLAGLLPRALYRAAVLEFCDAGEGAAVSGFTSIQALGSNLAGTCDVPSVQLGEVTSTTASVGWTSPNADSSHAFEAVLQFDADPPNNLWIQYAREFVTAGGPQSVSFQDLVVNARYRTALIEYCDGTNPGGAAASSFVEFETVSLAIFGDGFEPVAP